VIPIHGEVDPGMAAFVERAFQKAAAIASDGRKPVVILEIDTFGGRVDAALDIVDTVTMAKNVTTVAWVKTRAISAGALIALACQRLVMAPGTTFGDCAPITYSSEGPQMMGEKFQSPLRAKFRSLARRNHYPQALAEAMVSSEMAVYRVTIDGRQQFLDEHALQDLSQERQKAITSRETIVAKGELLTMDDVEALDLGFAVQRSASVAELVQALFGRSLETVRLEPSWSESLVRLIGSIAPILMIIGLAALYTEIKAPGFGIPGIVGILCLALVFWGQYLAGLADQTELLIICTGMVLLAFEVFVIPGFGIAGLAGMFCIMVGMVLSLQSFVLPDPSLPWEADLMIRHSTQGISALLAAILLALFFLRFILPRISSRQKGPYLMQTLRDARTTVSSHTGIKVGDRGLAVTLLRPAGKIEIGDTRLDVTTEGDLVEKGRPVIVARIDGNRIIVAEDRHDG
jgi:membrane-bound serine protease (ClpP class)